MTYEDALNLKINDIIWVATKSSSYPWAKKTKVVYMGIDREKILFIPDDLNITNIYHPEVFLEEMDAIKFTAKYLKNRIEGQKNYLELLEKETKTIFQYLDE